MNLPCTPQECLIPGAVGELEILMNCPKHTTSSSMPYAIICHPHPLYGGSMMNKVVYILANTFNALGAGSVRFNFRGVGKSQGQFDQGDGEIADLLAVTHWLQQEYAPSQLWLAGFSFGACIAARAHCEVAAHRLLLVAPAIERGLQLSNIPTLVIQGQQDEVIAPEAVAEWIASQSYPPRFEQLPEADHFFHGQLHELREVILRVWNRE